ncbi:MAG: helix-turn-helix domain-containing protein [Theionarchaea archaeon]|nr:helix-turn-helix domain-containing protein [Theionarchaea archaeon]
MYYAEVEVCHSNGLCNRISQLQTVKTCLIDRADVLGDGSVYIELLVRFGTIKEHLENVLQECVAKSPDEIVLINIVSTHDAAKLRYIIKPEANSVIRETNKMGFILDYPIIVQEEKETISGVVYKDESLQTYINSLRKAGLKHKIKKIVKNDEARRMSHVKWSWPLVDDVGLTEMQRKVVYTAFKNGYYTFPRKADIKGIAETIGLSTSTTWEHLRKAETKFMRLLFGMERS